MVAFHHMLLTTGIVLLTAAIAILLVDVWLAIRNSRFVNSGIRSRYPRPVRWRMTVALISLAWAPMLLVLSVLAAPQSAVRTSTTPAPCISRLTRASAVSLPQGRTSQTCETALPAPAPARR